jgi:hypothetical protein
MINLPIPSELNGAQLEAELKAAKLPSEFYAYADQHLVFETAAQTQSAKIQEILDAHIPATQPVPTLAEKLAAAGITLEELKAALA